VEFISFWYQKKKIEKRKKKWFLSILFQQENSSFQKNKNKKILPVPARNLLPFNHVSARK
jgi:hypothetical protein